MKIHKFTFNPFGEHTYIVWNEQSKKAAIIDPGMMDNSERTAVAEFIENNNLSLQQLFNTHMHVGPMGFKQPALLPTTIWRNR